MSEGQGQGAGGQGEGQGNQGGANGGGSPNPAGGGGGGDWRASLPADIRDHGSIKNYKDVGEFAKGHIELHKSFSSRKMQDMEAPSDPESRKAVLAKLGHVAPAKAEEYGLKFPDGYKGPRTDDMLKAFSSAAVEAGLTKDQAAKFFENSLKHTQAEHEKLERSRAEAPKRLEDHFRKEWGDKYDENKAFADKAWAENIPDPKMREALERLGVNMNADMVKVFAKIGRISQEGYMWNGSNGGGGNGSGDLNTLRTNLAKFEKDNQPYLPGGSLAHNRLDENVVKIQSDWRAQLRRVSELEVAAEQQKGGA